MSAESASKSAKNLIIILFVAAAIGAGFGVTYLAEKHYFGPMREQKQMVANLKTIVANLTKDVRMAEVAVVSQTQNPLKTTFKFVEVSEKGEKIGAPKTITVDGDEVYFDTLVIKFEENFSPQNDSVLKQPELPKDLFNKSIILFRRAFSDRQKPEDGVALDMPGRPPEAYDTPNVPNDLELKLWSEFWDLANDPKLAQARGVRAAHGQAVSMKLRPEKYYVLERRLSGDLTIRAVDIPAVMRK